MWHNSPQSAFVLSSAIRAKFGRLDVVIPHAVYAEESSAWFQQDFVVNTVGIYHAAQYLIPLLFESENGTKSFFAWEVRLPVLEISL